jgi:predicted dehydrogenase
LKTVLRAASIGLGWWSDELAAAVQGKSDAMRIVSCYSRNPAKRAAFAKKFDTLTHDSFEAVLADKAIDAVVLTTPHSRHAAHVIAAAAAGKHVFVEKPFTLTAASARAAAAACDKAGIVLAVGHNRRYTNVARRLKAMVGTSDFGTILHAEANFSLPGALSYTPERWRANRTESPGGAIAGLGIHMIDLLNWLLGPMVRVSAQAVRRAVTVDIDDTTSALFAFASGATGYLGTLFACPRNCRLSIYGTKANAHADIDGELLDVRPAGGETIHEALPKADTLKAELEEFAAACAGRGQFGVRPQEAIHAVAVMEAMVASAGAGGAPIGL